MTSYCLYLCFASTLEEVHITIADVEATILHSVAAHCNRILNWIVLCYYLRVQPTNLDELCTTGCQLCTSCLVTCSPLIGWILRIVLTCTFGCVFLSSSSCSCRVNQYGRPCTQPSQRPAFMTSLQPFQQSVLGHYNPPNSWHYDIVITPSPAGIGIITALSAAGNETSFGPSAQQCISAWF